MTINWLGKVRCLIWVMVIMEWSFYTDFNFSWRLVCTLRFSFLLRVKLGFCGLLGILFTKTPISSMLLWMMTNLITANEWASIRIKCRWSRFSVQRMIWLGLCIVLNNYFLAFYSMVRARICSYSGKILSAKRRWEEKFKFEKWWR